MFVSNVGKLMVGSAGLGLMCAKSKERQGIMLMSAVQRMRDKCGKPRHMARECTDGFTSGFYYKSFMRTKNFIFANILNDVAMKLIFKP